jgi:pimeloyl-ACP methyl ester carboxylesterase
VIRARRAVEELGAVCLTFDLSGHGASGGERGAFSLADHLDDVTAAYDRLLEERVDPERIGVCGASYGGYLGAVLTDRRRVRRLLIRAPALYSDDHWEVRLAARSRETRVPPDSRALRALRGFAGEVLVIESGRDEVIPPEWIAAYREAALHAEHLRMPEATHALVEPAWQEEFLAALIEFFRAL